MRISAKRLFIFTLLLLPQASAGEPADRPKLPARPPIEGTFIQYQDWMMNMDAASWRNELDAMRRAGIDIIIIQWLEMSPSRFIPSDRAAVDPTRIILEYADKHGMKVFIGLAHADFWWTRLKDRHYLDIAAETSTRVANEAWARYGGHTSFEGWYLSQELRDAYYTPQMIKSLRTFFKGLSDHCRALSGRKRVLISPAMSGLITPAEFGRACTSILLGSGIDVVVFQDGVGARGWDNDLERYIAPYFGAMRAACRTAGIDLWSDIEIFHRAGKTAGSVPASIERIRRQIAAESPFVSAFVMFDFFHYMSPYRGDAQKKLYEDYLREIASPASSSR
jgi:hypothetical protein